MTLDEAIKHCDEVIEKEDCSKCAKEHEQLKEWLEELKALEIIDKRDFFNDRAGRKLWSEKPIDIQNEDIKNAHEDYKLLKEYILNQPEVNEWIPVEERLPKEHEIVLVAYLEYISNTKQLFNIAYISECGTWLWYFDGTNVRNEIIAWMPLPEPYKRK